MSRHDAVSPRGERASARRLRGGVHAGVRAGVRVALLALVALAGPGAGRAAGQGRGEIWVVVVHEDNPTVVLTREQVTRLFLKKVTRWSTGAVVEPVDLAADSPVRAAFTQSVLARSVPTVKAYWNARIFSGRDTPPPERPTQAEVLAYVRSTPAAAGYVAADVPLPPGVRVLTVVP